MADLQVLKAPIKAVDPRWFGRRWLGNFKELQYFKHELCTEEPEKRAKTVSDLLERAGGKPHLAKLALKLIMGSEDTGLCASLADAFIKVYPTISQKDRSELFKQLVYQFYDVTRHQDVNESKALILAKIFEHVGENSNTLYADDNDKRFAKGIEKLNMILHYVLDDEVGYYKEHPNLKVACAKIVYSFEPNVEFLEERLRDPQTAVFAVEKLARNHPEVLGITVAVFRALKATSFSNEKIVKLTIGGMASLDDEIRKLAISVAFIREMPEVVPYILSMLNQSTNIPEKQKHLNAIGRLSVTETAGKTAKAALVSVIKGKDNLSAFLAIAICVVNRVTLAIPAIAALSKDKKAAKDIRESAENALIAMATTSREGFRALKSIIDELVDTVLTSRDYHRSRKAEKELHRLVSDKNLEIARIALVTIERVRMSEARWGVDKIKKPPELKIPNGVHQSPFLGMVTVSSQAHGARVRWRENDRTNAAKLAVNRAFAKNSAMQARVSVHQANLAKSSIIRGRRKQAAALRIQGYRSKGSYHY